MTLKLARGVATLLAAAVVVAGCGGSSSNDSAGSTGAGGSGGTPAAFDAEATVRTAVFGDGVGGMDPEIWDDLHGGSLHTAVYEGLLRYKTGTTEIEPALAETYEASRDGRTYTFRIRQGVRFHDGTPLTPEAVVGSFERRAALRGPSAYLTAGVVDVEARGSDTVVIRLRGPEIGFLDALASIYGPRVISPAALRAHGAGEDGKRWFASNAVGTGPLRLLSFRLGDGATLERFDGYWGEPAKAKRYEVDTLPSSGEQQLQLRSGQLDYLSGGSLQPAQLQAFEGNPRYEVTRLDQAFRPMLVLNTNKPPFDDVEKRKAFVAALDVDAAIRQVWGDELMEAPTSYISPFLLDPALNRIEPLASDAALDEPITFEYVGAIQSHRQFSEVIQQQLRDEGVELRLSATTGGEVFSWPQDLQKAPNAAIVTVYGDSAYVQSLVEPFFRTGSAVNFLGYSNRTVDATLDEAAVETDRDKALQLFADANRIVAVDDASIIPLGDLKQPIVARRGVSGFQGTPTSIDVVQLAAIGKSADAR